MSGTIGVAAFEQDCTEGEQCPISLPPREADRPMDNVVGDRHDSDEDQKDQKRGEPPKAGVRRKCVGRQPEEWPGEGQPPLALCCRQQIGAKRIHSGDQRIRARCSGQERFLRRRRSPAQKQTGIGQLD